MDSYNTSGNVLGNGFKNFSPYFDQTSASETESSDDDDVTYQGEKSFNEQQEDRRKRAIESGNFLDLTESATEDSDSDIEITKTVGGDFVDLTQSDSDSE